MGKWINLKFWGILRDSMEGIHLKINQRKIIINFGNQPKKKFWGEFNKVFDFWGGKWKKKDDELKAKGMVEISYKWITNI